MGGPGPAPIPDAMAIPWSYPWVIHGQMALSWVAEQPPGVRCPQAENQQ